MLTVAANEELKMTSREIAELTGKRHFDVMRDIERMFEQLGEDVEGCAQNFVHPQNGQQYREYALDREHTECLVTGYNATLRMKVIKRLHELEERQAPRVPQTYPEALRLAAELAEQNIQLGNQLAIAAPKAEFYDRYADASGTFGFRQVCKALGEKEHLVRTVLVDRGVMYRLGGQLTPYQNHIDAGRFTVKTGEADNGHAFTQARFTTKGVTYVAGLIAEYKLSAA